MLFDCSLMLNTFLTFLLAVSSFTARFVQDKHVQLLQEVQHSEGQLVFRQPDYLKWEYTSPQPLVWELDGDKTNMNAHVKSMVMLIRQCITGDFDYANRNFIVVYETDTIILKPKKREMQRLFQQMVITLDLQTEIAREVTLIEANGDQTIIRFFDIRLSDK